MIIGVQGSNTFDNYNTFMRAMGVALSDLHDDEFFVYSFGPVKINNFVAEFCNLSERGMKARGKKIKFFKVPISWGEDNAKTFNYFAYLCNPKESPSHLSHVFDEAGIEVGVFRY